MTWRSGVRVGMSSSMNPSRTREPRTSSEKSEVPRTHPEHATHLATPLPGRSRQSDGLKIHPLATRRPWKLHGHKQQSPPLQTVLRLILTYASCFRRSSTVIRLYPCSRREVFRESRNLRQLSHRRCRRLESDALLEPKQATVLPAWVIRPN